jgi:hypothetical protein
VTQNKPAGPTQCDVQSAHLSFTKPRFGAFAHENAPGIRNVLEQLAAKDAQRRATRPENIRPARCDVGLAIY